MYGLLFEAGHDTSDTRFRPRDIKANVEATLRNGHDLSYFSHQNSTHTRNHQSLVVPQHIDNLSNRLSIVNNQPSIHRHVFQKLKRQKERPS